MVIRTRLRVIHRPLADRHLRCLALRLPFLNQAIQGDDPYYLYGAEHAQIDPLHPDARPLSVSGRPGRHARHPHPPLNSWILAAPLAVLGDVREIPFHFALHFVVADRGARDVVAGAAILPNGR